MKTMFHPRETVLVSSRAKINIFGKEMSRDNFLAVDWHMPISADPPMFAVSISKKRFSYELMHASRVFVVNFMDHTRKKEILIAGTTSGKFKDKFAETGLSREESDAVDCPRIKEAMSSVDCEVVEEVEAGDHIIFIAKAVRHTERARGSRIFHTEEGFSSFG